jgi:succinate dehydrogenase / fumarate reductase, flavoprotein subunit
MQGLADGYFVLPYTIGNYFASHKQSRPSTSHAEFKKTEEHVSGYIKRLLSTAGKRSPRSFHRELGQIIWNQCGMARSKESLTLALKRIPELREEFWRNVKVAGSSGQLNQALEQAGRVADFLEFGELLCLDALMREESCGGHFRVEHQEEGECRRNDAQFAHVAAWEYQGPGKPPVRHEEPLVYEETKMSTRSYK